MTAGAVAPLWISHYPAGVVWDKRYESRSLCELFDQAVTTYGPQTCTHFLGRTMTYNEVGKAVAQAARGLSSLGIGKGDKVGLLFPNTPAYLIYYYAILKTGACVVNFNPLYTLPELRHQIRDSGTRLMVTHDLKLMYDKVEALIREETLTKAVIVPFKDWLPTGKSLLFQLFKRGQIAHLGTSDVKDKLIPSDALCNNDGAPLNVAIDPENDLAVLQYTGGTTGTPKGAMLTHANLTINVAQIIDWATILEPGKERIMGVLPFFHVFAMTTILNFGIAYGMQIILMPKFELEPALKLIDRLKPTVMPGVPTLYNAMLNHPQISSFDLTQLRFCISGGAGLPVEVKERFEAATGCTLVEGYGLSETSPVATVNPVDGTAHPGSIGLPLPATHISVRSTDDPKTEMPTGQSGEICIKGPQVMPAYWNKPEETETVFVDGYFRTGDVGYIAGDGFIYIVDRLKDMINASGYKIYPRQIEDAIYRYPAVEEVVVIGVPDEYRGEAPKAFIKLKEGQTASTEDLIAFLKTQISKLEMPAEIEFRDALPKTMIGKLSRKELREEAAE